MFTLGVMPYRRRPIVVGETYHIFNRSIAREPIFLNQREHQRALEVIEFYSFSKPNLRFSFYNRLPTDQKLTFIKNLREIHKKSIELLVYCLMPNHAHFLIRQTETGGIERFMSNFQNSYAKYFNTKNKRSGALFQSMFKAVRIETDEQLLHVGRYVHLNPLTSYVVREKKDLEGYPWSSYLEYIGKSTSPISNTKPILNFYSSIEEFKKFTLDQINYQRELNRVKHLTLE
ncbi:MAG: hypothetical protein UY16_C0017G0016 [Candidatus Gottesmanbacteria bacterium GW2011_GWA2_47_9]|uniref:Transposase IS200-like domain-containing protein n=3 Tax=Candidatus Gottesmaniibacteriota TaxID=1752720 RepID=A0A0G1WC13_9BACT|nr:MAG: hypothetical protein UY16_C0017G0016 [Candidatus Gottesmanbacteria bacterium GW2011_GWA2_47_9]